MHVRYPAALMLTLAVAPAHPAPKVSAKAPHLYPPAALAPGQLYSARALRRAKIILQLKLLELRSEHLERVRRAVERRIPIDLLLKT